MTMNSEVKAKWLQALRSGEYQQGTHGLKNPEGCFCCLGVLCNISQIGEWDGVCYKTGGVGSVSWLPLEVAQWSGIPSTGTSPFSVSETQRTLSKMNDDGCSFPEIADWIERNL